MANSNIETSFQNLVNVIKEKTYPAASGAAVEADIADIKIDITDLGISKIGISQIGMSGGVAPTSHTHTKSQITDFPESMPASDVHTWAKAANKPDYTPVEIGAIGISQIGMANGVASLGNDGKVPSSQLPAMTIPVTSVNNKTGDVVLTPSDIEALGISQVGMANGVASLDSEGKVPSSQLPPISGGGDTIREFRSKTWNVSSIDGNEVWTDGTDIYCNAGMTSVVLNETTGNWDAKSWTGLSSFSGNKIWTDGEDIFYSISTDQKILDKANSTWTAVAWTGLQYPDGANVWSDGENTYYSYGSSNQYVLDKANMTWVAKTWNTYTNIYGAKVWTDGTDIYYSDGSTQYVLDKDTSTWSAKTWSGLTSFDGLYIWHDGEDVYYSYGSNQYILDKATSNWTAVTRLNDYTYDGSKMWTDGENTYFSGPRQEVLVDLALKDLIGSAYGIASLNENAKLNPDQTNRVTIGKKSGTTLGTGATADGNSVTASGSYSHAEGYNTTASANYSHAEGENSVADHAYAHAEGGGCQAKANYAHAEGASTQATENCAHAEGNQAKAKAYYAHAEGCLTEAKGESSHAEGYNAVTNHAYSHAEGDRTKTGNNYQHVEGKFNIGKANTAWEIGMGTADDARANAAEVDWNGNMTVAGDITDGSGNTLSTVAANTPTITSTTTDPGEGSALATGNIVFVYDA